MGYNEASGTFGTYRIRADTCERADEVSMLYGYEDEFLWTSKQSIGPERTRALSVYCVQLQAPAVADPAAISGTRLSYAHRTASRTASTGQHGKHGSQRNPVRPESGNLWGRRI